jgi:hypothetical protein
MVPLVLGTLVGYIIGTHIGSFIYYISKHY